MNQGMISTIFSVFIMIQNLRGYNKKNLDAELIIYTLVLVSSTFASYKIEEKGVTLIAFIVIIISMVLSYFMITRKTIETVLKKIKNIAIKLKKIVSKKNKPEEPILRVYCFIAALMFFGFVIGHYIKKDWSVSFLGIIFLVILIFKINLFII